jgi:lambda family phage portal protein
MREVKKPTSTILKPTIYEKAMAYIAPSYAGKVYKSRCALAMVDSYKGASKSRRNMVNYNVKGGDFDSDVLPELQDLRERSEDLYRNDMLASGAINTKVTSIVGRGLTAQSRIDADFLGLTEEQADTWEAKADREWALWSESKFCTVNKKHNFRELQALSLLSTLVRGDCFTLTPEKEASNDFPYKLRMQLIEADRVINENNQHDGPNLSGGIETDSDGAPKKLHILKGHPGNYNTNQTEWHKVNFFGTKTGRRNVLHLYSSIRGDQSRGVPDLSPVIEGLKQFATLTQATVDAAVIQTFLSVLIETPDGTGLDLDPGSTGTDRNTAVKLESNAIIDLAEGEKAVVVDPTHPNSNYPGFAAEFYTQVGTALNIPHELLVKHFQSSYSAAQAALKEAWRFFMVRRSWLIDNLCQPAHDLFLAEIISSGRLSAPGFFSDPIIRAAYSGCDWVGPPMGHIRDDVQNKADGYAEDRGWKTSAQNTQERGGIWERNHRQRVKEVKRRLEDGLIIPPEEKGKDMVPVEE